MSRFAKKASVGSAAVTKAQVRKVTLPLPDTTNRASCPAFSNTHALKLTSIALTSFLKDDFYRSQDATVTEVTNLVAALPPLFSAKLAVFARKEYGMRSVSHLLTALVVKQLKGTGEPWLRKFISRVVHRVDDSTEIMSAYLALAGKPIPNALKKGLCDALQKFNRYSIAKYRGENNDFSLVDLFNLIHPKPVEGMEDTYRDLMSGKLKAEDTWETEISAAGQKGAEKTKQQAWAELVTEKKLGYMALVRNLRNILTNVENPKVIDEVCDQLRNREALRKSLLLPFRFLSALNELQEYNSSAAGRRILAALGDAAEFSLDNVPVFDGETLVAIDASGSMASAVNKNSKMTAAQIACLLAGCIAKRSNADLLMFDHSARYVPYDLNARVLNIASELTKSIRGGATNFSSIFETANKAYNRVIILSDMQTWVGGHTPQGAYQNYCVKHKAAPSIYCYDLVGYGTCAFPTTGVMQLFGYSEKSLTFLKDTESGAGQLLAQIEAVDFN